MVYTKLKIRGHIYAFVNEIADDGEKFCYLLLDDAGAPLKQALPKDMILYTVGVDDPDTIWVADAL